MSIHPVMQRLAAKLQRTDLPNFGPGDTVRVQVKIKEGDKERVQAFEGIVIARKNGAEGSFTVRKMSFGQGVERIFPCTAKWWRRWKKSARLVCAAPSFLSARPAWQGSSSARSRYHSRQVSHTSLLEFQKPLSHWGCGFCASGLQILLKSLFGHAVVTSVA